MYGCGRGEAGEERAWRTALPVSNATPWPGVCPGEEGEGESQLTAAPFPQLPGSLGRERTASITIPTMGRSCSCCHACPARQTTRSEHEPRRTSPASSPL